MSAASFSEVRARPQGAWWRVWLLGALAPMLVAMVAAVALNLMVNAALSGSGDAALGAAWPGEIARVCLRVAIAFLAIQLAIVAMMALAERRGPKPPPAWLFAGVVATTPLILYLLWPNAPVHPMFVLMIYGLGMAGAAIGRRIRHGGRWE